MREPSRLDRFGIPRAFAPGRHSGGDVTAILATVSGALAVVDQDYLLQARQVQALSLAVHIPLVCFGIAFPAMVLFAEWRYLRTGDSLLRTLARRWPARRPL
jgi:hypothetical protein